MFEIFFFLFFFLIEFLIFCGCRVCTICKNNANSQKYEKLAQIQKYEKRRYNCMCVYKKSKKKINTKICKKMLLHIQLYWVCV